MRFQLLWLLVLIIIMCLTVACSKVARKATVTEENRRWIETTAFLHAHPQSYQIVKAPEGAQVRVFHPEMVKWIEMPANPKWAAELLDILRPHLDVTLNKYHFPPAAKRNLEEEKVDETHYDAIWVRDSLWIYQGLKRIPARKEEALKLLLATWDYFASKAQMDRLNALIEKPRPTADPMDFPHIRFNGNSPEMDDVLIDGKVQRWNHKQMDAYGLFLLSLLEAAKFGELSEKELSPARREVLLKFPLFFSKIKFHLLEDAGAWEELERRNTSSISLATRSLELCQELRDQHSFPAAWTRAVGEALKASDKQTQTFWRKNGLSAAVDNGYRTIKKQLKAGGESPDYSEKDLHYRQADAALLNLVFPSPLKRLQEKDLRQVVAIVEKLERPFGILRYQDDSYQSGNFWFPELLKSMKNKEALESKMTGDTSSTKDFEARGSQLIQGTEAQWFFDSWLALAYLHLARVTKQVKLKQQDLLKAAIHLKRAVGQLTGKNLIAADGTKVGELQAPESINTVVVDKLQYQLPSPISPLNWARAKLSMALLEFAQSGAY
ncbi:MAG: hypothetical protein A2X86_11430 [Bdellovibrionales bacterium GWA2_49_15]|nr:MAG: hypothetical protein A2X86_11430 [Bdellovibrionales bacterium GWA2_49_15]HAZ12638.1 hypothetical protein [Bdellovibrionales bacterium]